MTLKSLSLFTSTLLFTGVLFAQADITCPQLSAIQNEQLKIVDKISYDFYATYNFSKYNTDNEWGFVIIPVEAKSDQKALKRGNEILAAMSGSGTVQEKDVCVYNSGVKDVVAAAVYEPNKSPKMTFRQLLKFH